ncbi:RagB/SusD family nutrient uptake outer membrane protein [Segetibacter sp. 3557_3]|uniref:RagB/SusD family nutrient uptake outer membrane protein n=1 Tax=Segetibacter sp. 3557_3 TaxID=2547429 RepID=UPI0010588B88|nr:RagB/SusD family nutrient uptake outer membrane protein [Segetibacter sp. 3557_3]TDH25136.1 RagB/SusD family nutrient uptake outer membrane protein [Segetibacter sp. 3557_3]
MKLNSKVIIIILAVVFTTSACNKFLERPPEGQLTKEEAFADEQGLIRFANGINTLLGDGVFMGGRHQILNELLADHYRGDKFTGDYSEIYKRQNSYFGATRDDYYNRAYQVITRANVILENLSIASSARPVLEGQAKFFRGIMHFEMVRMFAQPYGFTPDNSHPGVPIRTGVSLNSQERATVKEVYDIVIADLKSADSLLPTEPAGGKFYTPTKWAAKAYLAKVYFQMNSFPDAFSYADQVIKSNKFQLDTSYNHRFSEGMSKEGIYVIQNQGSAYAPGSDLRGSFRSDQSPPGFTFTDQFYAVATSKGSDKRKAWYSNTLQAGLNVLTKYNKAFFDLPIIHLTEIKLIRAEAGAETGSANLAVAISDINEILTRAYGGPAQNLPATASAAAVIAAARTERELELVGEGNRVQEIKRIGVRSSQNLDRRGSPWNCPGFILQFPKGEQDANASFQLNPEGNCF